MAVREILILPDKRLRKVSEPVKKIDAGIRKLVDDMLETMYDAPGIGCRGGGKCRHRDRRRCAWWRRNWSWGRRCERWTLRRCDGW